MCTCSGLTSWPLGISYTNGIFFLHSLVVCSSLSRIEILSVFLLVCFHIYSYCPCSDHFLSETSWVQLLIFLRDTIRSLRCRSCFPDVLGRTRIYIYVIWLVLIFCKGFCCKEFSLMRGKNCHFYISIRKNI